MNDYIPNDDGRTPKASDVARCGTTLDPKLQEVVDDAMLELRTIADQGCYCDSHTGKCDKCVAVSVLEKLERLAYPVVRSLREDRLTGAERVYFEKWVDENARKAGLNGRCGVLELILSEDPNKRRVMVSQRDMDVATAVVQWLGTNCGLAMLHECEQEVKRRRQEYGEWGVDWNCNTTWGPRDPQGTIEEVAKRISEQWGKTESGRWKLRSDIIAAMKWAFARGESEARADRISENAIC